MQLVSGAEFLAWAAAHGIGRSLRWPKSGGFVFPHPAEPPGGIHESWWTTWALPADRTGIPHLVQQLLAVAVPGLAVYVRPWHDWPSASDVEGDPVSWPKEAARLVAAWDAEPRGDAVVRFEPEEHHLVAKLLDVCLAEAAFNHFDVIPADGRLVLATCHDGEVHGDFPTREAVLAFDAALRALGYHEPDEPASERDTA